METTQHMGLSSCGPSSESQYWLFFPATRSCSLRVSGWWICRGRSPRGGSYLHWHCGPWASWVWFRHWYSCASSGGCSTPLAPLLPRIDEYQSLVGLLAALSASSSCSSCASWCSNLGASDPQTLTPADVLPPAASARG